ncbi:Uncharacterised protein [uncultured archaeon]|nr:Uncharacterised protein [uncultured archaeon]
MSPPNTVRNQLQVYRAANAQMENALGNQALAKKAVVAQQMSDSLWTDPVSQEVYLRYPITLTKNTSGVTTAISVAGQKVAIWYYTVTQGVELQFLMDEPQHYIGGAVKDSVSSDVDDYEAAVEVWDQFERDFRGTVWVGTTTEINDSATYRQNGHPLCYNGDKEVRAIMGDKVMLKITTPSGGSVINTGTSTFSLRAYHLILKRSG